MSYSSICLFYYSLHTYICCVFSTLFCVILVDCCRSAFMLSYLLLQPFNWREITSLAVFATLLHMACPVSTQRSLKVSSSFLLCMCWRTFGGVIVDSLINTNYSPLIVVCSVWDVAFHPLGVKEMFLLLRVHVLVAPCTSWLYNDPQTLKQSFTDSSLCTLCYSLYINCMSI